MYERITKHYVEKYNKFRISLQKQLSHTHALTYTLRPQFSCLLLFAIKKQHKYHTTAVFLINFTYARFVDIFKNGRHHNTMY